MTTWTTEYIDNLPDSSFLYVAPGGSKDSSGKTDPRSLRHLPVRDAQGNVDRAHLDDALSRIRQADIPRADKEHATTEAHQLLKQLNDSDTDGDTAANDTDKDGRSSLLDLPPRDSLVRTSLPFEVVRADGDAMPILHGRGAVYSEWTEINSRMEGHFMERFAPGSFAKTITERRDQIRCLFHHGLDPSIGMKPLGPITDLSERSDGVHYEVQLLDTPYNRDLVPGIEAGVYGSSFRFGITRKSDVKGRSVSNAKGLLERTITEAYMRELGPTPFPAYGGTTAGIRSLTDEFVLGRFPTEELLEQASLRSDDRDLIAEMRQLGERFIASGDTDSDAMRGIVDALAEISGTTTTAPSSDAAPTGTSRRSAATTSTGLYGLDRDEEVTPSWRL